jgi:K+-transporting ATPase ATPase A chain
MMVGRFGLAIPALGLAGMFAAQQPSPDSAGTLPTTSLSFAVLLTSTALIVSALSYFPALALGPILEHLSMTR